MTLKIISAQEIVFEGQAKKVTLPGTMGAFTVLDRHASMVSTLAPGTVAYTDPEGTEHELAVPGGLADIDNNVVSVCIY
ncbi:MAG: hypothetical protein LIP09_11230 [Bacteroidales bacterium]|nr:hypothetical protein [Bacteroidales bacterium]